MTTRLTCSFALLLGLSSAFLWGCSEDAPRSADSPRTVQAGYRPAPASDVWVHHEGATPSGAIGSGDYDEPGQLPPNSGGTNAGRVGVDAR